MTLILALVLVLVVLIIIDLYRKSLRLKQKEVLREIEQKGSEELLGQVRNSSEYAHIEDVQREYPLLRDGFLLFYFEAIEAIEVKDLATFLKYYGVKYTDEKIFQKINYKDVIFTVLADNESQEFISSKEGKVDGLIAVMNYKKLTTMEYDVKTCYELMMDVLEALSKSFHGTLMNEHRIRLTKKDKQNYLEAIL
ncbi:membrane protein [Candidatus Francisella endociliophora]|uniref:Cell division protein ZipA n=1 Tax=Candidatus Francisella endociliophora TaxID=653937 RepID=A0A097EQV8_9GAMM|nr:cell division protein ZipA C-terminal FtsZ-binding domain-containing protein [Francisella sp. FSC1006]AIT09959.1 membrane protein [Francisella sp. FSC1006]